uniref:DUF4187 domain-containing protein n=1 Tax=Macrostomum lignano TaxID=282301 RepID=A0A1I8FCW5_9PLAT
YRAYKEEFVRRQLAEFFDAHKSEEWFKEKYHPDFYEENIRRCQDNVNKRLRRLRRRLRKYLTRRRTTPPTMAMETTRKRAKAERPPIKAKPAASLLLVLLWPLKQQQQQQSPILAKPTTKRAASRLRKIASQLQLSSSSSSSSDSSSSSSSDNSTIQMPRMAAKSTKNKSKDRGKAEEATAAAGDLPVSGYSAAASADDAPADTAAAAAPDSGKPDAAGDEAAKTEASSAKLAGVACRTAKDGGIALRLPRRPRPLHKTQSIFLRNLHPSITRKEVEALCKAYPGFVRLALQDPLAERKILPARGWVTFKHDVNIKEICWNLNNIRLKECDLGAIVNRELSMRVRPIMTVANHRTVMRQDIRLAAKIVQQLDAKQGLHTVANGSESAKPAAAPQLPTDLVTSTAGANCPVVGAAASSNPLLKNLAEFIVDEGSYEEEALLGGVSLESQSGGDAEVKIEIEPSLQGKLDRLILYLRAVHSVDFYSATEYPSEDDMPHRCGIMHARGAVTMPDKPILQREVDNTCANSMAVARYPAKKFKGPEFIKKHIFNKHQSAVDDVRKDVQYFNNYIRDPKRPHVADPAHHSQQQQQQQQTALHDAAAAAAAADGRSNARRRPWRRLSTRRRRDFDYGGGGGRGGYGGPRYDQGGSEGLRPNFTGGGGGGYPQQREFGGGRGAATSTIDSVVAAPRGGFRGGRPMAPTGRKLINYQDLGRAGGFLKSPAQCGLCSLKSPGVVVVRAWQC